MFSAETRRYFRRARGYGHLAAPTHLGAAGDREQGYYLFVELTVGPELIVEDLAFTCPRCVPAIACGAYLYDTLVGQPVARAQELTTQALLQALGGLPPERLFYAWMAVEAVQQALKGGPL